MWRPIKREDVRRGVAVNSYGKDDDSPYSISTIIAGPYPESRVSPGFKSKLGFIMLARPKLYAQDLCDTDQPMVNIDTFELSVDRLLAIGIVWVDCDNGQPRSFTVR